MTIRNKKADRRCRIRSRLEVTPLEDGCHWELTRQFYYDVGFLGSGYTITVPAGFVTDFASFPRFIWRGLMWWLPGWVKYSKPSPLHDYLYQMHGYRVPYDSSWIDVTRKKADCIFLEAMGVAWRGRPSARWIARMLYIGVRLFGWWPWKQKKVAS